MSGLFEESYPEPETQAQPVDLPDWLKNYDVEVPESETSYPEHEVFPTLEPSEIGEEFFPELRLEWAPSRIIQRRRKY